MKILKKFDPWNSKLCTCPPKLTLNPYTGCEHRCVYCYVTYVRNFFECRPKRFSLKDLEEDARKLKGELVSMSNSSDPYPSMEKKLLLTRNILKILSSSACRVQLITKSTLVLRDIDILKKMKAMVCMTITSIDDIIGKRMEPGAPEERKRIKAVERLLAEKIPVAVRIDPIIPLVNDDVEKLIRKLGEIGVKHITSSTYKVKPENWRRFSMRFPAEARILHRLYFEEGEKIGNSFYLPRDMRLEMMKSVKEMVEENGMKFGVCREGFPRLNSAICDGSWLLRD